MTEKALLVRAQDLWCGLARVPAGFGAAGEVRTVVSPESGFCPPGWIGAVVLAGAALVTVPDAATAARLSAAATDAVRSAGLSPAALASEGWGELRRAALPVLETLGPAVLAYLDADEFAAGAASAAWRRELPDGLRLRQLAPGDGGVVMLSSSVAPAEAGEAGLEDITSPVFAVVREADGQVVAACGYWVSGQRAAHFCVLTASDWRGRGLAGAAGAAAAEHALAAGLLPQWRARLAASRRVATRLGFRELGVQRSFRLV